MNNFGRKAWLNATLFFKSYVAKDFVPSSNYAHWHIVGTGVPDCPLLRISYYSVWAIHDSTIFESIEKPDQGKLGRVFLFCGFLFKVVYAADENKWEDYSGKHSGLQVISQR